MNDNNITYTHYESGDVTQNWNEDSNLENGNYFCKCVQCEIGFIGHKRRHICKNCDTKNQKFRDEMTEEERSI